MVSLRNNFGIFCSRSPNYGDVIDFPSFAPPDPGATAGAGDRSSIPRSPDTQDPQLGFRRWVPAGLGRTLLILRLDRPQISRLRLCASFRNLLWPLFSARHGGGRRQADGRCRCDCRMARMADHFRGHLNYRCGTGTLPCLEQGTTAIDSLERRIPSARTFFVPRALAQSRTT